MTHPEYEQKRTECWEEFCRANPSHNKSIFARKVFNFAFDCAYALGMEAKDAEEEEMLTVSRKRVREMYAYNEDILSLDPTHSGAILLKKKLQELFGSKCLPDEEQSKQKDCDNPLADKEGCKWRNDSKCAFDSACYFEPLNPQEPKKAESQEESRNLSQKTANCENQPDRISKGTTKYYFISYISQTDKGVVYSSCLFKAVDITLNGIVQAIQENRGSSNVAILSLKDLTEEEYKMLKGEE